jgi:endogenous inhibitor of DNA gyrase (YacG/DUF329 family)
MADYQLIYNCPGCGKPSKAPEGALTSRCEYCDLVIRIGSPRRILKYFYPSRLDGQYAVRMAADRYLKAKGLPLTENVVRADFYYLPYYRFRGIALDYIVPPAKISALTIPDQVLPAAKPELKAKDFDVTIPAYDSAAFGMISLGVRPQSVPVYAYSTEEIPGGTTIVESTVAPQEAKDRALKIHHSNTLLYNKTEATISAMIGERISVIYFPIWALIHETEGTRKTVFIDALAKRGYLQADREFMFDGGHSGGKNSHHIKPLRHQCPNCGADLKENHFSLFYPCRNCDRSYLLNDDGYIQVNTLTADSPSCAPFWRFPLEFDAGRSYKTVSDFSKILGGEIALMRKEKRPNQFYLYSPAFKSSDIYSWFDKAYSVLRTQPHDRLTERLPSDSVALSIDEIEAGQMAVFIWRMLTLKYAWKRGWEFDVNEDSLQPGQIVWLPTRNKNLINKTLNFKEVNVSR